MGGQIHAGKEQNRWHELAIYRTAGGKWVGYVRYCTQWQREDGHDFATWCAEAADLVVELKYYNPTEHVKGFPVGGQYAEKQARLTADLRECYEHRLAELLGDIDEAVEMIE